MGRGRGPVARVEWTADVFDRDRALAIDAFRRERLEEPLEDYLAQYDGVERVVSAVLREYRAALAGDRRAADMLVDPAQREVLRYLAGPPISMDDLKVLADAPAISARSLAAHPSIVARLVETIRIALDPRRFPWLVAGRDPTDAESHAAVVATTALIASQRVATRRRTLGKQGQEELVRQALIATGFTEVAIPGNVIRTFAAAPAPGHFTREVVLGERKADLTVGPWDRRIMPIECKVSNSSTNSVKRLNNDAAGKATIWNHDFGTLNVVPVAV
nr:XamI family restriction endonuclease [Chloroflexia bacterium]